MPVLDETGGILFKDLLKVGIDELAWLQWDLHRKMDQIRHWVSCGGYGLVIPKTPSGDLDFTWAPILDTTNGGIAIDRRKFYDYPAQAGVPPVPAAACSAVDTAGQWITHVDDREDLSGANRNYITVPNDNAWYTVVMTSQIERREQGFIAVSTGDKTWTGTGTRFTQYLAYTDDGLTVPRGTLLRIDEGDSANGNEGTYTVDQVASDTSMEMREFPNGTTESRMKFYVQGASVDGPLEDGDYRSYLRPVFTLVSGHVCTASAGEFLLWEVKRNGADIDWVDKRYANLYQPAHFHGSALVLAPLQVFDFAADLGDDWVAATGQYGGDAISSAAQIKSSVLTGDIAPKTNGGLLAVAATFGGTVYCRHYFLDTHADGSANATWGNPTEGADITVSTSALEPTVCAIPRAAGSDAMHLCIYTNASALKMRTSTDNGATWSSASTICNPPAVGGSHVARRPFVRLLQSGRLLCMFSYYDGTDVSVRFIYSDDRGATWVTNSNAGFAWSTPVTGYDHLYPSFCQDDSGRIHTAMIQVKRSDDDTYVYYETSFSKFTLTRVEGGTHPDSSPASAGRYHITGTDVGVIDTATGTAVAAEPGGSACVIFGIHRQTGSVDKAWMACVQFAVVPTKETNPVYDLYVDAVGYYAMPLGQHFWNGFPDGQDLCPRLCQARDGWHLVWLNEALGTMVHSRMLATRQPINTVWRPAEV
jgi:hypothetical protein